MKHTLKTLNNWCNKHYPELQHMAIDSYCNESGRLKKDKTPYHYGYNSLKWLIYSLRETLDNNQIEKLFYQILVERKALNKSFYDLEHNILKFPAAKQLKEKLANKPAQEMLQLAELITINIKFNNFDVNDYIKAKVIVNTTKNNLTNLIFKHINPDIIIFKNPDDGSAGYVINADSTILQKHTILFSSLFIELSEIDTSGTWKFINSEGNGLNLMINKQGSDLSHMQLIAILLRIFVNKEQLLHYEYPVNETSETQQFASDNTNEAVEICLTNAKEFSVTNE
jgi:hypothetical protein